MPRLARVIAPGRKGQYTARLKQGGKNVNAQRNQLQGSPSEFRRFNGRTDRPRGAALPSVDSFDATGCNYSDIRRSGVKVDRLVYNLYELAEDEIAAVRGTI